MAKEKNKDGSVQKQNAPQDKIYNIIFEKKKTKPSVKSGIRIVTYLIGIGILVIFLSNGIIKMKYGKIIQKVMEYKVNEDMVILDYSKVIDQVSPSLVSISDSEEKLLENKYFDNNTTGVILDANGTILTNYSAIEKYSEIFVKLSSSATKPIKAKILVENKNSDVAIIKVESDEKLKPIKFAEKDSVREGQAIVVLGNAIGDEYIGSVIPGIITSKNEYIIGADNKEYSLLQVNAPIIKENTGGAICNAKGELVGLASLNVTRQKEEQGLYYALQLNELEPIINSTNTIKSILGVVEGGLIIDSTTESRGFYVQELEKGGNAFEAGIKPTDIIVEIDNSRFIEIDDITSILNSKKKGDILNCTVLSNGELKAVEIKLIN